MAWVRFDAGGGALASIAATLLRDILCFCFMAVSHPLILAYVLFFSPHLLAALSFLAPLLVSTCFLLLALLTVSPYHLRGSPPPSWPSPSWPSPPSLPAEAVPFCNTLSLVVGMLDPSAGGETETELPPSPEALCDIVSALQACVDSVEEMYREIGKPAAVAGGGSPGVAGEEEEEEAEEEEKRIVAEAARSSGELFGWELETISKLYRALTYEVEEFPVKLALRSFKEEGLFPPEIGLIQGGDRKLESGEPGGEDLPRKETPWSAEFECCKVPAAREKVDIPLWNPSKSAIKRRDLGERPDCDLTGEISISTSSPPRRPTARNKASISRSESDGSRSGKLLRLRRSSSSSSASKAAAMAAAGGLSRVASARGWSAAGNRGVQPQGLSSTGSMRKEKEWRRTLACKLFEERMVADGCEEGMDLLWETYEQGSGGKVDGDGSSSNSSKEVSHSSHDRDRSRKQGSNRAKRSGELHVEAENDDDEDEEEEATTTGKLCCLQALRFSPSKMGLGMGRSGLLRKVSRAMKGVGVLRRAAPRSGRKTG